MVGMRSGVLEEEEEAQGGEGAKGGGGGGGFCFWERRVGAEGAKPEM